MQSFQSFQEFPHQKLFFDLKDKNYKKAKMKGWLGWMKNIGNDPRSLFNGNHFSSIMVVPVRILIRMRMYASVFEYFVIEIQVLRNGKA